MTVDVLMIGVAVLVVIVVALSTRPDPPTQLPGSVVIVPAASVGEPSEYGGDALALLILLMLAALVIAALT